MAYKISSAAPLHRSLQPHQSGVQWILLLPFLTNLMSETAVEHQNGYAKLPRDTDVRQVLRLPWALIHHQTTRRQCILMEITLSSTLRMHQQYRINRCRQIPHPAQRILILLSPNSTRLQVLSLECRKTRFILASQDPVDLQRTPLEAGYDNPIRST